MRYFPLFTRLRLFNLCWPLGNYHISRCKVNRHLSQIIRLNDMDYVSYIAHCFLIVFHAPTLILVREPYKTPNGLTRYLGFLLVYYGAVEQCLSQKGHRTSGAC
jgi:hypothetical protein